MKNEQKKPYTKKALCIFYILGFLGMLPIAYLTNLAIPSLQMNTFPSLAFFSLQVVVFSVFIQPFVNRIIANKKAKKVKKQ